jgi:hypothetical protein
MMLKIGHYLWIKRSIAILNAAPGAPDEILEWPVFSFLAFAPPAELKRRGERDIAGRFASLYFCVSAVKSPDFEHAAREACRTRHCA